MAKRTKLGLIGKNISYSFSSGYFLDKFKKMNITELTYKNFDIPAVEEFPFLVYHREEEFKGFNVTIPYKQSIIKYLSELDADAAKIGAVNTIKVTEKNELIGYNTDIYGFENSLKPLLKEYHSKALILGTGGASKAVVFVLNKLNISYKIVSRNPSSENEISYVDLSEEIMTSHKLIINSSPVGTHPNIKECPKIPYEYISDTHYLFDLIYNPEVTMFLQKGKNAGAAIKNGLEMLELQAEKSWEIWNS
jgi:shikimate dehydrogenase|tara:strand:- start:30597 stop:31346 length:750 start_codon:yes stop_codon:yes gene_type:complete